MLIIINIYILTIFVYIFYYFFLYGDWGLGMKEEAFAAYLNQFGMKINDKIYFDDFKDIIKNNCSLEEKFKNKNNMENKINNTEQIFNLVDSNHYTDGNNSSDLSE